MQSEKNHSRKVLFTPEVIVINDNDPDQFKASKKPRKRKKKPQNKHKREVKVDKFQNMETLVVTQKVKMKKQKFKCIINLTKICEHKNSEELETKKYPTIRSERIVPQCLRKCSKNKHAKKRSKHKCSRHAKKKSRKPKRELDSISLISLSSLENYSELSYEDVSSDSFTTIPSEDDIDILIKRTKDRDRQQSQSFSSQYSQNANTPKFSDVSDTETSILRSSDKDSLHSTATFVIAPQPEIYSPTRPTTSPDNYFYMDNKSHRTGFEENNYDLYFRNRQFSPTITYDNKFNSENIGAKASSVDYKHSCNLNNEPYSPSEEPVCCDQKTLPYEVQIKFDDTEMDDLMDKTEIPKSLNMIEGNPKIKIEGSLTNCILPQYDQRYQSNGSDHQVKVKIEKDVNGNENNENGVYVKSETAEIYYNVKIKEERGNSY